MVQGIDGNFYGTSAGGGTNGNGEDGCIFKITPDGTASPLFSFDYTNGSWPAALKQKSDGSFFGTTIFGGKAVNRGAHTYGTVFRLSSSNTLTKLFAFNGTNGYEPTTLVEDDQGNLYGITTAGGIGYGPPGTITGNGTVFKIDTNGAFSTFALFQGTNGAVPMTMIRQTDGNFYGLTWRGGLYGFGTVFKMTADGTIAALASFDGTNGSSPETSSFFQRSDGNFYGVASWGGHGFNGSASSGNGVIFKMTPEGMLTPLAFFDGTNGSNPGVLAEGPDGNLYGATLYGGAYSKGTLFRLTVDGILTSLFSFDGTNGRWPDISLVSASDGNFYGTTKYGGAYDRGTVYRLSVPFPPRLQPPQLIGSGLTLSWSSVAGQLYQLQFNSDPATTNWNDLGSAAIATNGTLSGFDPSPTDSQRFYRAYVLP